MIKITDFDDVRQKFYATPKLPVTYEVVDSDMSIKSMISTNDFSLRGYPLRNGFKTYIRECRYLYGMSFSINDEDLSLETIRIFIDGHGKIYLGKIESDKELIDSVLLYMSFYICELTDSIRKCISSIVSKVGKFHNISGIEDIHVNLPAKTVSIKYSYEDKMKLHKGLNFISSSKIIGGWTNDRYTKLEISNISKMIYAVAKSSQTKYEEYMANLKEV